MRAARTRQLARAAFSYPARPPRSPAKPALDTDAVLEPLPTLEHEPHRKVASSFLGSKGLLELFLGVGEASPAFPGETVRGHAEFTPNGNHTIDCVKLYVSGSVAYEESVVKHGISGDTRSTYSWGQSLFRDVFDIAVETPALKKGQKVSWPFAFPLSREAKPSTARSSTDFLLTIRTTDNRSAPANAADDFSMLASQSSGCARTDVTFELAVGGSAFPDPAVVQGQNLLRAATTGALQTFAYGSSDDNAADHFIIRPCQWAAPFEVVAKDESFSTGLCCGASGLADVAMSLAHRIIMWRRARTTQWRRCAARGASCALALAGPPMPPARSRSPSACAWPPPWASPRVAQSSPPLPCSCASRAACGASARPLASRRTPTRWTRPFGTPSSLSAAFRCPSRRARVAR